MTEIEEFRIAVPHGAGRVFAGLMAWPGYGRCVVRAGGAHLAPEVAEAAPEHVVGVFGKVR